MIDKNSQEYVQFEKLWNGITPKGNNISKKNSFRSKMKNSCHQEGLEFRIATKAVGDRVLLKTIHRGNERDIELVIIAPPFNPKPNRADLNGLHPLQGVTVANLSPGLLDELGITSMQRGVIILKLIRGRVANRLGFRFGDIILEINGFEVNSVARLKELVSYDSDTWKVLIKRRNEILSLVIPR